MPRRVYTYLPQLGYEGLNLLATAGAFTMGLGVLVFLSNVARSLARGQRVEDPWRADSLEWATSSPPPPYKFAALPRVQSRYPLWAPQPVAELSLRGDRRAVLVTTLVDAEPDHTTADSIAHAAVAIAREVGAKLIVTLTETGLTARLVSKARAMVPIMAFSSDERTLRQLALLWGVAPHALSAGPARKVKFSAIFSTRRCSQSYDSLGIIIASSRLRLRTPHFL